MKNSVLLMGNLGGDPVISEFSNGGKLTRLSLATHEYYRDKSGELIEKTEWHRCIAWGKLAEKINERLRKGSRIAVRGKLTYRSYEDKEGKQRTLSQIEIKEYTVLEKENRPAA
jgi:single-strand DNA-binding protein